MPEREPDWDTIAEQEIEARRDAVDAGEQELGDDWEPCDHSCDEDCYDYQGFWQCRHQHCFACGGCGCPGYCDDYQTYNLRPEETGGAAEGGGDAPV